MNFKKLTTCILILSIFTLSIYAQNGPRAELFEEFEENPTAELIWVTLDGLYNRLNADPNARGYVFIYGTARQTALKEKLIRDHITARRLDPSRIVLVNVEESEIRMRFWVVPAGAEPPEADPENNRIPADACPRVTIIEPAGLVTAGENMIFSAEVTGIGDNSGNVFNWSIDNGSIVSGQGTPTIKVGTEGLDDTQVTASVSVSGNFLEACESSASGSGLIKPQIKPVLIDKFQRANCEDVLMRVDNFFRHLQDNPGTRGFIIIYGKRRPAAGAEREARNWIKIRNFSPDRLTFINGGGTGDRAEVEMWLVPLGANPPEFIPQESEPEEPLETKPEKPTEPYIFSSEYDDRIAGCDEALDVRAYSEALRTNPKSRGNIVIYATTRAFFREREKEILAELTNSGIDRKRLRTFYVKTEGTGGMELWLLP